MIRVPQIGGLAQARLLTDVKTMARELVAVTLDIPLDTVVVDIHVAVDRVDLLIDLAEVWSIFGARRRLASTWRRGEGPIPWEPLKAELGLR